MPKLRIVVLLMALFAFAACEKQPPASDGEVASDASGPPERGKPQDRPAGPTCVSARDCPGENCDKGRCVPTDPCDSHRDCPSDKRCYEDRCVNRCIKDPDCPKDHVCTDGMCHKPEWKAGKPPNDGSTQRKPLRIGMAVTRLDFPLGVSMAGFGFRPGPRGPYARSLGASTGMYDRFDVKVLILDDGVEQVVLIRSPLIFTTDFLLTQIAQRVIDKTGIDLTNKIIMTSTHSHSAPARFWNLLPHLNFGTFGGGDFMAEVFRRLMNSFTEAILQAQKDLKPGKIGYAIDPNFDPEGLIFSDRRGENPKYKEPRLLVLKAQRMDGTPLAAVVSFPMHGTISENTMLTNDASGGLEFKLQEKLEALEKKRVEVFFMQGPAGDISPRGDRMGHKGPQQMQMLGALAAIHIEKLYKGIQTKADITLEVVNRRLPLNYKDIGYKDGEFFYFERGEKVPYRFGGFQCVKDGHNHDSGKKHKDGNLGCIFSVEVLHGASVPQFSKTRLSAVRIGDLVLSTFPGESTSHIARRLREGIEKATGGKLKDIIVLGYSQDHQLYIVGQDDWWQGGYEASTTIWGPKAGEYLLKHAIELTSQLATPTKEKNDTGILPQDFYQLDLTTTVPRKQTPNAGKIDKQPPKQVMRMSQPVEFVVNGGFHGVDNPHVVLQKKGSDDKFADVKGPGGRLYDEFDYKMTMTFVAKKDGTCFYTFHFQELQDFPVGTYRFRVEGIKWDGSKRASYTATTDAFELVASDKLRIHGVASDGKTLRGWIAYPAGTNDDGKSPFASLNRVGHRLRSHLVPWQVGPPLPEGQKVELKVTIDQAGKTLETLTADTLSVREVADVSYPSSRDKDGKEKTGSVKALSSGFNLALKTPLTSGTYQVTIEIKDAYGNTGSWTQDVTIP